MATALYNPSLYANKPKKNNPNLQAVIWFQHISVWLKQGVLDFLLNALLVIKSNFDLPQNKLTKYLITKYN